jgi:hypothetical protein
MSYELTLQQNREKKGQKVAAYAKADHVREGSTIITI